MRNRGSAVLYEMTRVSLCDRSRASLFSLRWGMHARLRTRACPLCGAHCIGLSIRSTARSFPGRHLSSALPQQPPHRACARPPHRIARLRGTGALASHLFVVLMLQTRSLPSMSSKKPAAASHKGAPRLTPSAVAARGSGSGAGTRPSKPSRSEQKAAFLRVKGAATANSRQVHARRREEEEEQARMDDDDEDEEGEEGENEGDDAEDDAESFTPAARGGGAGLTLDMIATSTSHSTNKLHAARSHTPKHTPRPTPLKRSREQAAGDDQTEERQHTSTSTIVSSSALPSASTAAALSPAAVAAASSASGTIAALPSAPAATAAGGLFSDVTPALDPDILRVLSLDFGFTRMTPVQQQCIPTMLKKDVAVQSYTGSGKTLAFVLPMLQIILNKFTPTGLSEEEKRTTPLNIDAHTVAAIILSPTRELAMQICAVIAPFVRGGKHAAGTRLGQLRLASFIGGSAMSATETDFVSSGGNILVATPGRLNSTLGKLTALSTKDLRVLILDEADRLLDEGFSQDITDILRKLPKQRRTGLFSATQTRQVKELRRAGLQDKFAKIDVLLSWKSKGDAQGGAAQAGVDLGRTQMTPTTLQNYFSIVPPEHKLNLLVHFLVSHPREKIIVFFLTGDQVDYYSRVLTKLRTMVSRGLHKKLWGIRGGKQGMEQSKRNAALAAFVAEDHGGVLLATDVASRGLDVPDVDWIIQFDPPKDPSVFVHRIGRTARAGKRGSAIVYLLPQEKPYVELVRGLSVPIEPMEILGIFEANTGWKDDDQIGEVVKAFESGVQAKIAQAVENAKKRMLAAQTKTTKDASSSSASAAASPPLIRSQTHEVQYLALEDRLLMERAQKSYTSFVDGYKQHVMTHALNYTLLPYADLAAGMGLLYLPKMPDIKHLTAGLKYERCPVKAALIRFKDAAMQAAHEKREEATREKNAKEQEARENKYKERQKSETHTCERAGMPQPRREATCTLATAKQPTPPACACF